MQIQTLETVSLDSLAQTFTAAFADYFVKINMTVPALEFKMRQEQIDLNLSAGLFDEGQLVGFILNGIGEIEGKKIAYNGGTGLIDSYRGNRSTQQMYDYLFPLLKEQEVKACQLEVIDINQRAIKVYQDIGFQIVRSFDCLKGHIRPADRNAPFLIQTLENLSWPDLPKLWNFRPSWSYALNAHLRIQNDLEMLGAYKGELLIGYVCFLPKTGRITQFAVHPDYRRQKIATSLFAKMRRLGHKNMTVINVDKRDTSTLSFLQKMGFTSYIGQFEMSMTI